MREFAITRNTVINLLLTGLRLRLHRSRKQLAYTLRTPVERIVDLEHDASGLTVAEFVVLMEAMGVQLVGRVRNLSEPGPVLPENLEPLPPEPTVDADGRRSVRVASVGEVGHQIRMARLRAGKSQRQVQADMGLEASALSRLENGGVNVTVETLARYADYFKTDFVIGGAW